MQTLLLSLCGLGIGAGLCLAYATYSPTPPPAETSAARGISLSLRRALLPVACAAIAYPATRWFVAVPIAFAAAWFLPGMLGRDKDHDRQLAVIESIAAFAEMLRDTLSAASGLNQALTVASRHAPEALQPASTELAQRIEQRETTTREALRTFADQINDSTCDLVTLALAAASEHPTRDLAALLSNLAATAREQAAMRTRVAVAQTRTQTAIRMITITTLGLAALLLTVDHSYLANYDSATGQLILIWVAAIFALALRWLRSLAKTPQPERLWSTRTEATP